MLLVGGHRFYREKETGLKTRWHCCMKSRAKCKAFVKTIQGTIAALYLDHSH